jgi:outer membrane receptor protein involved in Fe transport
MPRPRNRFRIRKVWAALIVFTAGAGAAGPLYAESASPQIRVRTKPLRAALVDFAVQANISIATPSGGFGDAVAAPVKGAVAPAVALGRMLEGTGYSFEQIDAVSFKIVPTANAGAVPKIASEDIEDVIVSATRRPTTLDRMANAVTSLDNSFVESTGAHQTADIASAAAGVTLTNLGPGRNKIFMRGLSDGAFTGQTESPVGLYFDDSRVTYGSPDPDIQLVDIASVEFLRGPQGALVGAGSIGGLYHITSNKPDTDRFEGSLSARAEGVESGEMGSAVEGVLNVPIAEGKAGLRLVGYDQKNGGWLNNSRLGLKDANRSERVGGRVHGLLHLGDTWTVNAHIVSQKITADDSSYVDLSVAGAGRTAVLLEPYSTNFLQGAVSARGALAGGELTSTTSYKHHRLNERFDASANPVPYGATRTRPIAYEERGNVDLVVHEMRYAAVASPMPWYMGLFYSDRRNRSEKLVAVDPDEVSARIMYRGARLDLVREVAVLGGATFNVSERARLALAARYSWTDIKTDAHASGSTIDNFVGKLAETRLAPRVEFSYAVSPRSFLYVSAAEGYRSGGFNAGSANLLKRPAQPAREYSGDTLWSYEAGAKNVFWDGRLRTRVAGYFQDWRGVQTDQLIAFGLPFTGNVGRAQSYGAEAEFYAKLSDSVQARGQLSYTQAEVTKADPSFPSLPNSGLPGAPHLLAGASVLLDRPLVGALRLTGAIQARYIGQSNITYSRLRELRVGDYGEADMNLGVASDEWRASAYVENLFNGSTRTFSYGNPLRLGGHGIVAPQTPRTIGIELSRNF